jgi:hypothetical protein
VVDRALERTELSSRELACHFTDERPYFPWQLEQAIRDFVAYYNHER